MSLPPLSSREAHQNRFIQYLGRLCGTHPCEVKSEIWGSFIEEENGAVARRNVQIGRFSQPITPDQSVRSLYAAEIAALQIVDKFVKNPSAQPMTCFLERGSLQVLKNQGEYCLLMKVFTTRLRFPPEYQAQTRFPLLYTRGVPVVHSVGSNLTAESDCSDEDDPWRDSPVQAPLPLRASDNHQNSNKRSEDKLPDRSVSKVTGLLQQLQPVSPQRPGMNQPDFIRKKSSFDSWGPKNLPSLSHKAKRNAIS